MLGSVTQLCSIILHSEMSSRTIHSICLIVISFQAQLQNARYCFVGDEAFPFREHLNRPYPGKLLSEKRRIYNYSHQMNHENLIFENLFVLTFAKNCIAFVRITVYNFTLPISKHFP